MRRWAGLVSLVVLGACSVVGPSRETGSATPTPRGPEARRGAGGALVAPVRPFDEVRGLWVVRSTLTSADEVRAMVARADAAGFNTIIVQVRGRGDAFYRSRWEPRGETVRGGDDFDPLALAVEEAHARGIAVHAWVNTYLVWGPAELPKSPKHLVRAHPEWLAVPEVLGRSLYGVDPREPRFVEALHSYAEENTGTVEGVYASPSDPAVEERVYSVWMDLLERYDLDGLHFDYVRFPSGDFDYSRGALERFSAWVAPRLSPNRYEALSQATADDPYAFVTALPGPWAEFRRSRVTQLVRRIYHGVKARRPEVVVSAAVFANQDDAFRNRFQAWPSWLAEGILDVAVPMAYTADDDRFRELVHAARAAAGDRARIWAGVGAFRNSVEGTLSKIDIARGEDAGGVILFSYDWAIGEGALDEGGEPLRRIGRARFGIR
jgi:uncharacterized lipoprotein YddW (UPF0748 family)